MWNMNTKDSDSTASVTTSDNIFQLPSKVRKVIPIIVPNDTGEAEQNLGDTSDASTALKPSKLPAVPVKPTTTGPFPRQRAENTRGKDTALESSRITASQLDIYSQKYVPLWLRAINESPTSNIVIGKPLPILDLANYVNTFAGSDFIPKIRTVPPPEFAEISISCNALFTSTYSSYWTQRLQSELVQQSVQTQSFALYDTTLSIHHAFEQLYVLHVPGLRENTPRLDLGDVVQIRPLNINLPSDLPHLAANWFSDGKRHGYPAPGFTGILHWATVWAVNRQTENVVLHMDHFHPAFRCNIVFIIQPSKWEPVYRAVEDISMSFISSPWLRSMLFPDPDNGIPQTSLSQATFDLEWFDKLLNWEQKKAIHTVLSAKYGIIPYLISGPPGTGKTKTLVELALQYLTHAKKHHHVLVCAPSDAAADTIALRLSGHLQPHELFRLNSWMRSYAEVPDGLLQYTYSDNDFFSLPSFATMMSFRVVVTTCRDADILVQARLTNVALSTLVNGLNSAMAIETTPAALHWTALLLDEAAQATEPDVLIPLSVVMPPSDTESPHFVAAGDQYQLGPKLLSDNGLEVSLFQRLFERDIYANHPLSRNKGSVPLTSRLLPMLRPPFTNLIRNYRSHPAILSVPSSLFYNDTLIPERKTSKEILAWPNWKAPRRWPVLFQQNDGDDFFESVLTGDGTGSGALHNPTEATMALNIAKSLLDHLNSQGASSRMLHEKEITVMSPYRAQVSRLRQVFREHKLYDVNIGPLEAFQGLENRIAIICTTRTRLGGIDPSHYVKVDKARSLGMIDEPQRLNVAMTRAKEALIVIGNAHCLTCTRDKQWLKFLDFCKRNGCYNTPNNFQWPDLGGPYSPGRLEQALMYAFVYEAAGRRQSQTGNNQVDAANHDSSQLSSFKLRGPRLDMDEEMWHLRELAQQSNNEHVDMFEDDTYARTGYDLDPIKNASNGTDTVQNHGDGIVLQDGYDRNIQREFFDGCASQ